MIGFKDKTVQQFSNQRLAFQAAWDYAMNQCRNVKLYKENRQWYVSYQ